MGAVAARPRNAGFGPCVKLKCQLCFSKPDQVVFMPKRNKFFIDRLLDEMAAGFCSLLTDAKAEKRFNRAIFESVFHIFANKSASKQLGC